MQPQFIIRAVPTAYSECAVEPPQQQHITRKQGNERASERGVSDENSRLSPTRSQEIRRAMPFQLSLSLSVMQQSPKRTTRREGARGK
jgi:hypothetical protein